jgi:hypothetical protein
MSSEKPFEESVLLSWNLQNILSGWLDAEGKPKSDWKLSWRGSRDGFGASTFHSMCDNKGESVTVIKTPEGHLFGGYASVSWDITNNKRNRYQVGPGSFLFTISNPHKISPTKYSLKDPGQNAMGHFSTYGPMFGSGADIRVDDGCNEKGKNAIGFPTSYKDTTGKGYHTFTGTSFFTVEEVEVFSQQ